MPSLRLEADGSYEKLNSSLPSVNCGPWYSEGDGVQPGRRSLRPASLTVPPTAGRDSLCRGSAGSLVEAVRMPLAHLLGLVPSFLL